MYPPYCFVTLARGGSVSRETIDSEERRYRLRILAHHVSRETTKIAHRACGLVVNYLAKSVTRIDKTFHARVRDNPSA